MKHKRYEKPAFEEFAENIDDIQPEGAEAPVEEMTGIVTDCRKLNIRAKPDIDSEVLAAVNCLDELRIDPSASIDEWYAVCTAVGVEGFCMKKFVAVV